MSAGERQYGPDDDLRVARLTFLEGVEEKVVPHAGASVFYPLFEYVRVAIGARKLGHQVRGLVARAVHMRFFSLLLRGWILVGRRGRGFSGEEEVCAAASQVVLALTKDSLVNALRRAEDAVKSVELRMIDGQFLMFRCAGSHGNPDEKAVDNVELFAGRELDVL